MGYCAWIKDQCPYDEPWPSMHSDICDQCMSEEEGHHEKDIENEEEE